MKLTPAVVIETMRALGARSYMWRAPKALPGLIGLLDRAVLFEFGALHAQTEHKEFALDLYERKLFGLPYPVTAFSFEAPPHLTQHVTSARPAGGLMIIHQDEDQALSAIMCTEQRYPDGRPNGGMPISVVMKAKLSNRRDDAVDVTEATYPVMSDEVMAMMYGDAGEAGHSLMTQRLCSNLIGCMGFTVMLMSKGVEAVHTPAPAKLNKIRIARGKPPIRESYTVRIMPGDSYAIATESGDETIAGHVRGAPRLHWRRGHFRTLKRNSENERVIPVAPALIGANDSAEPIKRQLYKIG